MENSLHWPLLSVHRQKWQTDAIFCPQGPKITSSREDSECCMDSVFEIGVHDLATM